MEKTFDTAMMALKKITRLCPNQEDATKAITMAAIAYQLITYEGVPEEVAKKIVFRVESVQKYSRATLSLEERVYSFLDLITAKGNAEASLERVLALGDETIAANIDEMACTTLSQIAEDFERGC